MKIKILTVILLILSSLKNYAQIFDNEQANSNIKWKQINTSKFRLIFPEQFSSSANQLANTLENQLSLANQNLSRKAKKISIVVQENTLAQNGFVQLAPRKSEFYSTPSGVADNQSWLTNLALHEVRHVAQFDNLVGKLHKPFAEQLALALFALNLPSWYFEGDAVLHETLYSAGGRGRLASWQMPIRANIQSNLNYDFNKYVHGSYKDLVPSYYTIGYFMNSEMYQHNELTTANIYEDMHGKLIRPFNFQRALTTHYGGRASQLFEQTMSNLKQNWQQKPANIYPNRMLFGDKYPTDYILPQVQNGHIYAIQQSVQRVNRIVEIDPTETSKQKEVIKLGAQIMPYFDVKQHLIVWDEYRRNARYSKETFNVINVYNTQTKHKKTITYETRYYTPTLSPDLQTIACVEVDKANNSYLTLIETLTGKKIKSIEIPKKIHIQQPQYHANGNKIVAIGVSEKGTNLIEIDLKNEQITMLTPWGNHQIERPIYHQDTIIFKTNLDNKDDIFKLYKDKTSRITNVEFGAFNPSTDHNNLYFNDYTPKGLHINHINLDTINTQEVSIKPSETLYSSQNTFTNPDSVITNNTHTIENYNTLAHAINFHSISISGSDFESFDNLKPGLFFLSNDVLNTTQARLGIEYDTNIKKTNYSAQIIYQKYYPKITIGYQNRGLIGSAYTANHRDSIKRFDFRENLITANVQLPFVKYRGNTVYSYGLNFGTSYQYRYDMSIPNLNSFIKEISFPLNYQAYFNKNSRRSTMDIFPRWGQNVSFTYRHLPFEQSLKGTSWSLRTNFYFPGFVLNHGIQLRYAMQETSGRFASSYDIPLISGIAYIPYKTIKNTLMVDYKLPIAYPDWSLGQLSYLKRIYGGLSANYLNIHHASLTPQSVSASLLFDFNVFKYNLPNFALETKASYITVKNASKSIFPEVSLSYNY